MVSFEEMTNMYGWVNGNRFDDSNLFDRGIGFGDGVFETTYIENQQVRLLAFHMLRLIKGCQQLLIPFDPALLEHEIEAVLSTIREHDCSIRWRLKIIVTRGESLTGYSTPDNLSCSRIFLLNRLTLDIDAIQTEGVNTRLCDWPLPLHPHLSGIKHLNRLDQVMARLEWSDSHIFEGFMSDTEGNIIEGTCTNLFVVNDSGKLETPCLKNAGVAGVMRETVIKKLCPLMGWCCEEVSITSFDRAREIFITNAIIGIVPVRSVEARSFQIGKKTRQLQNALLAL